VREALRAWRHPFIYIAVSESDPARPRLSIRCVRAIANLHSLCREYLAERHEIRIVDVLYEPQIALDDNVMLTPMLLKLLPAPVQKFIGNLSQPESLLQALAIVGACFCWAIDNNLTRKISGSDPSQIAMLKGLSAGTVNLAIGLVMSGKTPTIGALTGAGLLGFLSYGVSLTCFVLALRDLGTARTSAYFSTAPFIGVVLSLLLLREIPPFLFWPALLLMIFGVWMHLTEHHEHDHSHEALEHEHPHHHDAHHQHDHLLTDPPGEPHTHRHRHKALNHAHAHLPDIHQRHGHR
jgi:hypothetical protein